MIINPPKEFLQFLKRDEKAPSILREFAIKTLENSSYYSENQINANTLDEDSLEYLISTCKEKHKSQEIKKMAPVLRSLVVMKKSRKDYSTTKVRDLKAICGGLIAMVSESTNNWLFRLDSDDDMLYPYFVSAIRHIPRKRDTPAHVSIELIYWKDREMKSKPVTIYLSSIPCPMAVVDILSSRGYYTATPNLVELYRGQFDKYMEYRNKTGFQLIGTGVGFIIPSRSRWGSSNSTSLEGDFGITKFVIDDELQEDKDGEVSPRKTTYKTIDFRFWGNSLVMTKNEDNLEDDDEEENQVQQTGESIIPTHPMLNGFDLRMHRFIQTHVDNLQNYGYNKEIINKLVLPADTIEVVEMLTEGSVESLEDIVKGKTGGIISICTGPPGVGKTLTAEVFSEYIERPLYVVQCSQLGTTEEELEKRLMKVLTRTTRWDAILLIDEADVYVRARGDDIQQNAIVGVFLRVLEYYRGILFMTSNRGTLIDDAIMSRAMAWIRYEKPTREEQERIWKILSTGFGLNIEEETYQQLLDEFPHVTGRNIKNLLKLASFRAKRKKRKIDITTFRFAAKFIDMEKKEEV